MNLRKLFRKVYKVYTFDDAVEKLASGKWDSFDDFDVSNDEFAMFRQLVLDGNHIATCSFDRSTNIDRLKKWLRINMSKYYIYDPDIYNLKKLGKFIERCRHVRRIDIFDDRETYIVWRSAIKRLYYDCLLRLV